MVVLRVEVSVFHVRQEVQAKDKKRVKVGGLRSSERNAQCELNEALQV